MLKWQKTFNINIRFYIIGLKELKSEILCVSDTVFCKISHEKKFSEEEYFENERALEYVSNMNWCNQKGSTSRVNYTTQK